jgi:hypothetical protein
MANQPKTGTVLLKDGNYFIEAGDKLRPIPVSSKAQPEQLKELVGKKVEILYSEPQSFVAGLLGGRRPILCYLPADPYFSVVDESVRASLAKQLVNEGVLSRETFEKLGG